MNNRSYRAAVKVSNIGQWKKKIFTLSIDVGKLAEKLDKFHAPSKDASESTGLSLQECTKLNRLLLKLEEVESGLLEVWSSDDED